MEILLLYFLTLSLPFYGFSFINIGERPLLRPPWFFAGLLILVFFLGICIRKRKTNINVVGEAVLILNLIAVLSLVALFNAENPQFIDFFTKWAQLVFLSLLFFAISNSKTNKDELNTIFRIWICTAFFISLYAIYQSIGRNLNLQLPLLYLTQADHFFAVKMITGTYGGFIRCSSIFSEPSFIGSYLIAPILFLGISLAYKPAEFAIFRRSNLKWFIFFTMVCALLLSFSLAAYITLVMMCVFIFLHKKLRWKVLKIGLITLVTISFIILGLNCFKMNFLSGFSRVKHEYIRFIAKSVATGSIRQRLLHNLRAIKIWSDHPLLGVGINNVPYYHNTYSPPAWLEGDPIEEYGGGNMWAMALGEMGIVGFGGLALLWISALLKMRQYVRITRNNSNSSFLALVFYYVLLGEAINSLFSHQFIHIQRWFYLSLAVLVMFYINSVTNHNKSVIDSRQGK